MARAEPPFLSKEKVGEVVLRLERCLEDLQTLKKLMQKR
jgi:hypothetical protein